MNTSDSDIETYNKVCREAAKDDIMFSIFKQNNDYRQILEHVTIDQGRDFASFALEIPVIKENLEKFKQNDVHGSPSVHLYSFGAFSPSTLRYVKVLSDLVRIDLEDKVIAEIGAGYGGQYVVLRQLFKPKKYIFIDLPDTLALIKKYIENNGLNDIPLEYYDVNTLPFVESDLVISNYAYSECRSHIQELYLKNVIIPAKHGYITYNHYDYTPFINVCQHSVTVKPEQPQTGGNNVVITW